MSEFKIDGWLSTLTGLGQAGRDKMLSFVAQWKRKNNFELDDQYAADDVTGRFVDEIPNEGTREWIELTASTPAQEQLLNETLNTLEVVAKFRQGWKWSRLHGGAGILINTNVGVDQLGFPLNLKTEGGKISSITVFSSDELVADVNKITADVANVNFGLPEFYNLRSSVGTSTMDTRIHHSRIIRIEGVELPRRKFQANGYWHDSVITKSEEAIRNYNIAHSSIAQATVDFSVPVIKIKNLAELVAADKVDIIQNRISIMNMAKSMLRMILIDDTETLEHLTRNVTGLPEAVAKVEARLVMSTRMPRTKILGESPGGMGSNGSSEERQWYDLVAAERERVIEKPFTQFFNLLLVHMGMPATVSYKFKSLWQQSLQEKATAYKTFAEADNIYMQAGVVSQTTVQESRFGGEEFGTEIELSADDVPVDDLRDGETPDPNDPNADPAAQQDKPATQQTGA